MTMTINKLSGSDGPDTFYDHKFCRLLEIYTPFIKNHPDNTLLTLDPMDVYKYTGDFYGLLATYNIPREYRWITMRVNGYTNPLHVPEELTQLIVPPTTVLRDIMNIFKTMNKK